ncbi:hypothetical protein JCM10049v2_003149 [Rhodotorula toruloides]
MSRAQTPKGAFDAAAAASVLSRAFQSELDAANRAGPAGSKPEIWKSKAPAPAGGAWGQGAPSQPKAGAMADGREFLSVLTSAKSSSSAAK